MSLRLIAPFALLLLAFVGASVWQYNIILDLQTKTGQQTEQLTAYQTAVTALAKAANDRIMAQQHLQQQQSALIATINQSKNTIRRLQRENDDYKNWAATQLPNVVKRLRQRPAITGADQYRQYLSARNTLHTQPNSAGTERGSDN